MKTLRTVLAVALCLGSLGFIFYGMYQETLGDVRWLIAAMVAAIIVFPLCLYLSPGDDCSGLGGGK